MIDMQALRRTLNALPQAPIDRMHPSNWVHRLKRAADFVGHSSYTSSRFWANANPYPKPFEHVRFSSEDGVSLRGWLGPGEAPWGLVIIPGMFGTKDDTIHKSRAMRIWRQWNIPVLVVDLRGFGESAGISTGGWKEAGDVKSAALLLQERCNLERVAVLSESLGGASTLRANGLDKDGLFGGGIMTLSAFVDTKDAVHYISAKPPKGHAFSGPWNGFRRMLNKRSGGAYERFDTYLEDAARASGLQNAEELYALATPKPLIKDIRNPTLAIHSSDDPIVPVRHARRLERYAADNPNVAVIVTNWGQHTGFEDMDSWWFWELMRRFYGAVNGVELPNLSKRTTPSLKEDKK